MTKKVKKGFPKVFALFTVLTLVVMGVSFVFGNAQASQMTSVSDTITDSAPGNTATHTVTFTLQNPVPSNGKIVVTFDSNFDLSSVDNNADVTCPGSGATKEVSGNTVSCSYASGYDTTGTPSTITVKNVVNPSSEGSYLIQIESQDSGGSEIDSGETKVAIVNAVTVSAHVPATLTFLIHGVGASTTVEAGVTNVTSTTTTIDFGTVNPGTQYIAAQKLEVHTNANEGFSVKVWEDHNLQNVMGNDIDKFKDGTTSSPQVWASPSGTLGSENTYGHFGLRSDDTDTTLDFSDDLWVGFPGDGSDYSVEVFKHNGPTDGSTQHSGWEYVEYALEISPLQEAGDYSNTLTYICTATF